MSLATLNEALRTAKDELDEPGIAVTDFRPLDEALVSDLWTNDTEGAVTSILFDFNPSFDTINCSRTSTCGCASAEESYSLPVDFKL
ncbi:hypothetical protein ABH923_000355 [Leifsonia sp. EB41]|jgi:hypothetical protein|uniref:hypothetical protein n=1 Tax=Leifsonia sp. EB41 TaxID=3156260 RepID=UPI0035182AF2